MLSFLKNLPYKHLGGVVALLLGLSSCEQQQALPVSATPIPSSPTQSDRYYVNTQPSTKEVIEQLDPKTITNVAVLKGQQAADYTHNTSVSRVVLVRTR